MCVPSIWPIPLNGVAVAIVIMLLVPLIMAWGPSDRRSPVAGTVAVAGPAERSRFSSDRERRLWLWTLVVLVAIYSTLSPAQELAAALRARNLLGVTTTAVLLVVGLIIAVHWVKTRPGRAEIGCPFRLLEFLGHVLILALSDGCQVLPLRTCRRLLI